MEHQYKHQKNWFDFRIMFGILVIAAGTLLLLENLFGYDLGISVWGLWPVLLILFGLQHILRPEPARQTTAGIIFILIGALFLGNNLDLFYIRFSVIWPVILILIGFAILRNSGTRRKEGVADSDYINLTFVFGGGDFKFSSKTLQGGKISAVLGGGKIDLREADILGEEIEFDLFAFWGGVELIVPETWEVAMMGMPLMGGMEDKTRGAVTKSDSGAAPKRVVIRGMAIMGGVEVKN